MLATVMPSPSESNAVLRLLTRVPTAKLLSFVLAPLILGTMMLLNGFQQYSRLRK